MATELPEWARMARAKWRYTGVERPPFAQAAAVGQRSVWDFPRPPAIEPVDPEVRVLADRVEIARSRRALRVLETGSPPTYYLPSSDVDLAVLSRSGEHSLCEWKGEARYWDFSSGGALRAHVAWSYARPFADFDRLRDHFSFYAGRVACFVGSVPAEPQPGDYHGGWVTPDLVGPFKGEPGTEGL